MYDADTLQRAFFGDEVERIQLEHHNLFALTSTCVPSYGILPDPDPEVTMSLDESDVNGAITELAAARDISTTDLAEQVFVLSGGEHDTQARAQAVLELAGMDEDELAEVGLTVSASERKKMAKSGAAMPGGHFPIHDLDHLASAKAFYHQGKYADQDPAEIHAHINRRAKALGGTGLDDDDGDEDIRESEHQGNEGPKPRPGKRRTRPVQVRTRGQSPFGSEGGSPDGGTGPSGVAASGKRMLVRAGYGYETIALSEDEEWAEAEIMRLAAKHPTVGLAGMRDPRNYGTVMVDGQGVTPNVSRHFDFDIHDVGARDDGDPSDPEGADTASVIARLQANHPEFFTEKPYGANRRGRLAGPYPGTGPSGKPQTAGR